MCELNMIYLSSPSQGPHYLTYKCTIYILMFETKFKLLSYDQNTLHTRWIWSWFLPGEHPGKESKSGLVMAWQHKLSSSHQLSQRLSYSSMHIFYGWDSFDRFLGIRTNWCIVKFFSYFALLCFLFDLARAATVYQVHMQTAKSQKGYQKLW